MTMLENIVFSVERNKDGKVVQVFFDDQHEQMSYEELNKTEDYLLTKGTDFQQKVWLELRQIPVGQTISYKEMAERIGHPKASRAVGGALAKNPLPIILPCHRVKKTDGSLGGFMGGLNALDIKQALLDHECSMSK